MSLHTRRTIVWAMLLGSFCFLAYAAWFYEREGMLPWQGPVQTEKILFGGDVFLGRQVEDRMRYYGNEWPFADIAPTLRRYKTVVVNFESAMAKPHVKTPHFGFQFSVDSDLAEVLPTVGVTHVSLANNHAYDHGLAGYENARQELGSYVAVFGNSRQYDDTSLAYTEVAGVRVALIGLYAASALPDVTATAALLERASKESEKQVIFVHWGEEYALAHNASQELLARTLITQGADMIVGHHPHVVQDIAVYDGVPVVYSLGNLVFDQYFSTEVQQGLLLEWDPRTSEAQLLPVTTLGQPIQPRLMTKFEKESFLEAIAARSDASLRAAIADGTLSW